MDDEERKKRNQDIIRRMKRGDPLQGRSSDTWFPPRPTIKKDKEAIKKLLGEDKEEEPKRPLKPV